MQLTEKLAGQSTQSTDLAHGRKNRKDGSFFTYVDLAINSSSCLHFHQFDNPSRDGLACIARMLSARDRICSQQVREMLILWKGYHQSRKLPEPLPAPDSSVICFSLNAAINYYLLEVFQRNNFTIQEGQLKISKTGDELTRRAACFSQRLAREKRLLLHCQTAAAGEGSASLKLQEFKPERDFLGVGPLDFPSRLASTRNFPLVFNSSFFLLELADHLNPFSLLGEHYNLLIRDSVIESPAIYRRAALVSSPDQQWQLIKPGIQDFVIRLGDKFYDLQDFSLNKLSTHSIYNRLFGLKEKGYTSSRTPEQPGSCHLIIIGRDLVGYAPEGGAPIPQNGFVLALPARELNPEEAAAQRINYHFASGAQYHQGIQAGPALVTGGRRVLRPESLEEEEFFSAEAVGQPGDCGVVPTDYAADVDRTRAARLLLGVKDNGNLGLLGVEGVSLAVKNGEEDCSSGATLKELADLAVSRGYQRAINLDGGGSTNIIYHGQPLIKSAGLMGCEHNEGFAGERMVPVVGLLNQ